VAISHSQTLTVSCPQCGTQLNPRIWFLIDAEEEPDAWQSCKEQDPHLFSCPSCSTELVIPVPLLLHDGRSKLVVYSPSPQASEEDRDRMLALLRRQLGPAAGAYVEEPLVVPRDFLPQALSLPDPRKAFQSLGRVDASLEPVLTELRRQNSDPSELPRRIGILEDGLTKLDRASNPTLWSTLQYDLGVCYRDLPPGHPLSDPDKAIAAFRAAVSSSDPESNPFGWAAAQLNLGIELREHANGDRARLDEAERALEGALRVYTPESFPFEHAGAQVQLGLISRDRDGALDRTVGLLESAVAIFERLRVPQATWARRELASTLLDQGQLALERDDHVRAEQVFTRLLEAAPPSDRRLRGQIHAKLAETYRRKSKTLEHCEAVLAEADKALELLSPDTDALDHAIVLAIKASTWQDHPGRDRTGNLERAIEALKTALKILPQEVDPVLRGTMIRDLGSVYGKRHKGDRARNRELAVELAQQAVATIPRESSPMDWGRAQHNRGMALLRRLHGNPFDNEEEALRAFRSAASTFELHATGPELAWTYVELAGLYARRRGGTRSENVEESIRYSRAAVERLSPTEHLGMWAGAQHNLGLALMMRGTEGDPSPDDRSRDLDEAIEALETSLAARERAGTAPSASWDLLKATVDERLLVRDWLGSVLALSQAYEARRRGRRGENVAPAIELARKGLAFCPPGFNADVRRVLALNLAKMSADAGRWDEARHAAEAARATVNAAFAPGASTLARSESASMIEEVYDTLVRIALHQTPPQPTQALCFAEEGRARRLREELGAGPGLAPPDLPDALRAAESGLLAEVHRLRRLVDLAGPDTPGDFAASLEQKMEMLEAVWDRIANELGGTEYVALRRGLPPEWPRIRSWIRAQPGTVAVLEYLTVEDSTVALLAHPGYEEPILLDIACTPDEQEILVRRHRQEIRTPPPPGAAESWQESADPLIAPVLERLDGVDLLYVVPSGSLHRLPLHAIRSGGRRLVDCCAVAFTPSIAALLVLSERSDRANVSDALVLGNPTGDLAGAAEEAAAVAALLAVAPSPPHEAGRDRVLHQLGAARAAHLATHAFFDAQDPLRSGLHLAGDEVLTGRDVMEQGTAPELVFLSACETGVQEVHPGEDPMGLPRAFLYAGSRTLVQSLWRVSDQDSVKLIVPFYEAVAGGATPATALRSAMLRAREEKAHSWYWAPFVLYGCDKALTLI
jgi:CHAT domain-containing protein/tetratricopeptide (TPR) repeat protein